VAYREAIELQENNAVAMNNLAYLFAERDIHLEEALAMVDQALMAEPEDASFLDTKGWVLYRLGHNAEALDYVKRALAILPDNQEIKRHFEILKVSLKK
jgi:Flp pilus assembly protein TadD